jgi:membrane protease YdiL (CAAX protease family)
MLKRILIIWLIANFVIVSLASWMVGRWYLGWQGMPVVGMIAELCLIMIPNAVLPIIVLRYWWPETIDDLRDALGWRWRGWRCVVAGVVAFLIAILLTSAITRWFGESIPYNLAETESNSGITIEQASDVLKIVGLLAGLLVFVVITVVGEETMFRGWIQTQVGSRYGAWVGLFLAVLLFGLRHLLPTYSMHRFGTPRRGCGWRDNCSCMQEQSALDLHATLDEAPMHQRLRTFCSSE